MARITFEPPANRADWERACNYFHVPGHPYYSPNTLDSPFAPCDLTIDPTKPETWARAVYAVYEAGVRAGREIGHFVGYRKCCGKIWDDSVTQQPAGKPVRMCHGTLESPPADNDPGWVYAYMDDTPPPNFFVNGIEYRPVT